jgi:uncharacterized membrane protein
MMWWNSESSWFAMWLMMSVLVGAFVLLLFLATRAASQSRGSQPDNRKAADAKEVLALRLARGDIDTTEYLDRMDALANTHDA